MKKNFFLFILMALVLSACNASAGPQGVWQLTEMRGQPPLDGTTITLRFEDGSLGGNSGCNSYGGEYQLKGSQLEFGALAMTEMACMDPEGAMQQESDYLQTLAEAPFFTLTADRLELANAAGETLLVFVLAE